MLKDTIDKVLIMTPEQFQEYTIDNLHQLLVYAQSGDMNSIVDELKNFQKIFSYRLDMQIIHNK